MKNKHLLSVHDIENILLHKKIDALNNNEIDVLKQYLGSIAQIKAYQQMLLRTSNTLKITNKTGLKPRNNIQALLRQKVANRKPTPKMALKNGFEPLLMVMHNLLSLRSWANPSYVFALFIMVFWLNNKIDMPTHINDGFSEDSIAMYQIDSNVASKDSNATNVLYFQMQAPIAIDSFGLIREPQKQ